MYRGRKIAKVARARKLAVHQHWMWRHGCDQGQMQKLTLPTLLEITMWAKCVLDSRLQFQGDSNAKSATLR